MSGSAIGILFRVTTWGESHGRATGVVVEGCPPGIDLAEQDIQEAMDRRSPGKNEFSSSRQETDTVEILSGIFDGRATGTPISMIIWNRDIRGKDYEAIKEVFRPGHGDFTYLEKYGVWDHRGGGRASGRETAARVAAGAIAGSTRKTSARPSPLPALACCPPKEQYPRARSRPARQDVAWPRFGPCRCRSPAATPRYRGSRRRAGRRRR